MMQYLTTYNITLELCGASFFNKFIHLKNDQFFLSTIVLEENILTNALIDWFIIGCYFTVLDSPRLVGKVKNGITADTGFAPYLASLRINMIHFCSGCLISEKFVTSTAHCILQIIVLGGAKFQFAAVGLGATDLSQPQGLHWIANVAYPEEEHESRIISEDQDIGLILVDLSTTLEFLINF